MADVRKSSRSRNSINYRGMDRGGVESLANQREREYPGEHVENNSETAENNFNSDQMYTDTDNYPDSSSDHSMLSRLWSVVTPKSWSKGPTRKPTNASVRTPKPIPLPKTRARQLLPSLDRVDEEESGEREVVDLHLVSDSEYEDQEGSLAAAIRPKVKSVVQRPPAYTAGIQQGIQPTRPHPSAPPIQQQEDENQDLIDRLRAETARLDRIKKRKQLEEQLNQVRLEADQLESRAGGSHSAQNPQNAYQSHNQDDFSSSSQREQHSWNPRPGPDDIRNIMDANRTRRERQAAAQSKLANGSSAPPGRSLHPESAQDGPVHEFEEFEEYLTSQPYLGEYGKHKQTTNNTKLGFNGMSFDHVTNPQMWPHSALQGDYVATGLKFSDLDFRLFCAGELEIITNPEIPSMDRLGRAQLLKQVTYLHVHHGWDILKKVYIAIMGKIERQHIKWENWDRWLFQEIQWNLATRAFDPRQKSVRTGNTKGSREEIYWCKSYQTDECTLKDPHTMQFGNRQVTAVHICATCWGKAKVKGYHRKSDPKCPQKTD
jgi:hypothetical protein